MATWTLKTYERTVAELLVREAGVSPITAQLLAARGILDREAAEQFLSPSLASIPDPFLMAGIEQAVSRLVAARERNEQICIYGDYDVDGISGTALLTSFLTRCGFSCSYFIPNRFDEGYGLNSSALEQIHANGAALVVSVDCGINACSEAAHCRTIGLDLIIVDHHTPGESTPDACSVINPHQSHCNFPYKQLCGVGVAFFLLIALRSRLREAGVFTGQTEPDLREWLDLVALGTVADVVPLTGLNRVLVCHGLRRMSEQPRTGLKALKQVARIEGQVRSGQVGFQLGPRLNAVGRMDSAVPGVQLLLTDSTSTAAEIARELNDANTARQSLERDILEEAIRMVDADGSYPERRSIVLASEQWHQGVMGIVASRLTERYYRPVILIALDESGAGKGSGRSIPGFDLLSAIQAAPDSLDRFGGHRYAAGVSVKPGMAARFAADFEQVASGMLAGHDLTPEISIDAEVQPQDVTDQLIDDLKQLEPFGAANPEPLLLMRGLKVFSRKTVGDGHLQLVLAADGRTFKAIAFRQAAEQFGPEVDVLFTPERDTWNGNRGIKLRIKSIRTAV